MSRWLDKDADDLIGTRADREALFDYLVAATERRQAISPAKNRLFGIDVAHDMGRFRQALLDAATPADLWYALARISNTRHDRHLSLRPVDGGLPLPPDTGARMVFNYADLDDNPAPRVGVELATDFSTGLPFVFLAGFATGVALPDGMAIGDELLAINGMEVGAYVARVEPYAWYSTPTFFWYHLPDDLVRHLGHLPDTFYAPTLSLSFLGQDGHTQDVTLEYRAPAAWNWPPLDKDPYTHWQQAQRCASYTLYRDNPAGLIALVWHGFGTTLVRDVDQIMDYCQAERLLDCGMIFDATRCRGGDFGGYLLQRLSDKPVRINWGDLRLSDITEALIATIIAEDKAALATGTLSPDETAATAWRKDWLENDVRHALAAGAGNTAAVPFKCAHQPKTGDGVMQPAAVHFSGPMVCLTMPFAGSHIDQLVAQISDNAMAFHIGMPLGGFSKTWIHEETLRFPRTGQPIARFMWSCGNAIRPNGEVLESNPAMPDRLHPVSRSNHFAHHAELVALARAHLSAPAQTTR
jgi:hypothetical protein